MPKPDEISLAIDLRPNGEPVMLVPLSCGCCAQEIDLTIAELRSFATHCLAVCDIADTMTRHPQEHFHIPGFA